MVFAGQVWLFLSLYRVVHSSQNPLQIPMVLSLVFRPKGQAMDEAGLMEYSSSFMVSEHVKAKSSVELNIDLTAVRGHTQFTGKHTVTDCEPLEINYGTHLLKAFY
jgi:hypothetical protein